MRLKFLIKSLTVLVAAVMSLSFGAAFAASSNVNGVIKGDVVDTTGNGVYDVQVTVNNPETGLTRSTQTANDGAFQIQVPPGTYQLTTSKSGYSSILVEEVRVGVGSVAILNLPVDQNEIEEVITYGSTQALIDTGSSETALNISLEDLHNIPVPRNVESVALLAPGTVAGDTAFGDDKTLVSFGGASVAENVYFIDGLNVTNFRNGLGGSSVPFEFYDSFQIKTGGYGAEFGRSLGGVINAVTKRGTNDFHYGMSAYFTPEDLRSTNPNTWRSDGLLYDYNAENTSSSWTTDYYVSGPILRDKLFFYVLYEPQNTESAGNYRGAPDERGVIKQDDAFYGANVTWQINDSHTLTATSFTDQRSIVTTDYEYDVSTNTKGAAIGVGTDKRGGDNYIVRYDGQFGDNLVISAMYGENKYDLTSFSSNEETCPYVIDVSASSTNTYPGCWVNYAKESGGDTREAMRFDVEYTLGDHQIRAGIDNETNTSEAAQVYSGNPSAYYYWQTMNVGTELPDGSLVPDANGDGTAVNTVRYRYFENGGSFETRSMAYYIEDTWTINDEFTASLGLRNETFENDNSLGATFIKITDQIAPRLSLTWSPGGGGDSRAFVNWGRYHLPVAANTNVRLAGAELDFRQYFLADECGRNPITSAPDCLDANGIPTSTAISGISYNSDGTVPDTRTVLDASIEPMYQDEWIVGYERLVAEDWVVGVRYIKRELSSTIDDILTPCGNYILTNPGTTAQTFDDCNTAGTIQAVTYTPAELGFPKAERTYEAVEVNFKKKFTDGWALEGSYTNSKNLGNSEGYVKSDNGQDDAGLTQDFDIPELMDGAYGPLPNDRRHKFKLWGSYQYNDNLMFGARFSMQSGRPINMFGVSHPDGTPDYGDTFYLTTDLGDPAVEGDETFQFVPRGTGGRTPWITSIDLSAVYTINWGDRADVELRADIFNLLNGDAASEVYEYAENGQNIPDVRWGLPSSYQTPRYVGLGAAIRF